MSFIPNNINTGALQKHFPKFDTAGIFILIENTGQDAFRYYLPGCMLSLRLAKIFLVVSCVSELRKPGFIHIWI